MSLTVDVTESVMNLIREHFNNTVTLERQYNPSLELSQVGETKLIVVPREMVRNQESRDMTSFEITVDILVLKKLEKADDAEIDALISMVEDIAERLDGANLMDGGFCKSVTHKPFYVDKWIDTNRMFTSRIEVQWVVYRRRGY